MKYAGKGSLILLRLSGGEWQDFGFSFQKTRIDNGVRAGPARGAAPICEAILSLPRLPTSRPVRGSTPFSAHPPQPATWRPRQHQKIRLGYLCGEFRQQGDIASSLRVCSEHHDKDRFELFRLRQ